MEKLALSYRSFSRSRLGRVPGLPESNLAVSAYDIVEAREKIKPDKASGLDGDMGTTVKLLFKLIFGLPKLPPRF